MDPKKPRAPPSAGLLLLGPPPSGPDRRLPRVVRAAEVRGRKELPRPLGMHHTLIRRIRGYKRRLTLGSSQEGKLAVSASRFPHWPWLCKLAGLIERRRR